MEAKLRKHQHISLLIMSSEDIVVLIYCWRRVMERKTTSVVEGNHSYFPLGLHDYKKSRQIALNKASPQSKMYASFSLKFF